MTTTAAVLQLIGMDGVVVGSVARGKADPKDVDVVVREARPEERRNPVFRRLVTAFLDVESLGPGHLWVPAEPLPVEVFCYTCWPAADRRKETGFVTYRQARRGTVRRVLFGVPVLVQGEDHAQG